MSFKVTNASSNLTLEITNYVNREKLQDKSDSWDRRFDQVVKWIRKHALLILLDPWQQWQHVHHWLPRMFSDTMSPVVL